MHSQRLNSDPLNPWVIAEDNGKIISAHCDCMAGLAEACTHIASLLWWIEITHKINSSKTVTDTIAYWKPPNIKDISPKRAYETDFRSSQTKKRSLDKEFSSVVNNEGATHNKKMKKTISKPAESELSIFYQKLNKCEPKAAILRILPNYAELFQPKTQINPIKSLIDIYNTDYIDKDFDVVLNKCHEIFDSLSLTNEQASSIEISTCGQSSNKKMV